MKVKSVIENVDRVKPNDFDFADKVRWLNEVEGLVQTDVLLLASEEIVTYGEEDEERELLVSPPHDKLYEAYLIAKIDFMNGEYDKYENTYAMFNQFFTEFTRWFADMYRPADGHGAHDGEQFVGHTGSI